MSLERHMQELLDIEAIRQVKARYFRCMDTKDWDGFAKVFAEDAVADYSGPGKNLQGRAAIVAFVRGAVEALKTVHHGHMPEIVVHGDSAHGIFAMADIVERPGGRVMRGYGHYHEDFVRRDGRWQILRLRLTRLRVDRDAQP